MQASLCSCSLAAFVIVFVRSPFVFPMHLRRDLHLKHSCGIDYIYIPAFAASGAPVPGQIVSFNEAGLYLWQTLQPMDAFTLQDAVNALISQYDIDAPIAIADCKATLTEWYRMGLLIKE